MASPNGYHSRHPSGHPRSAANWGHFEAWEARDDEQALAYLTQVQCDGVNWWISQETMVT